MSNPWLRLYAEFSHDPKVQMMSEAMQRRYIMLMCMRCSNVTETLHETEMAFYMRISDAELAETKALFLSKGFIDENWNLLNWEKRQFSSDDVSARVARHRERKKQACNVTCNTDVTKGNVIDTDTDTENIKTSSTPQSGLDLLPDFEQIENHEHLPNQKTEPVGKPEQLPCPYEQLVKVYHEHFPMGARLKVLNDARKRALKARWLEASRLDVPPFGYASVADGLDAWARFFDVCTTSEFLTGQVHSRDRPPFIADLDFFLQANSFAKCLENKYHREVAA